jgi:hypothetical protein
MDTFNPDTYCGIYCGACSIVMHGETGRADRFAACLGSLPKKDLACSGCKSDTVYAGCSTCNLRHCAREKGVAHCVDCADYPCKMYGKWQSVAKCLPHSREAASNLTAIAGLWLVPSGIALHFASHEGADRWSHLFMNIHNTASLLFLIAAIVHVILNWTVLTHYVNARIGNYMRFKRELLIAVLGVSVLLLLVASHALYLP